MPRKSREDRGCTTRVGPYVISADECCFKVEVMGLPDTKSHFFKGDPNKEIVKEELYYSNFRSLANGILEKHIKKKFQESGLKHVYTNALQDLISLIEIKNNET